MTYNLVIGTSPGASDILSPMSDRSTGRRRIVSIGNAGHNNSWTIKNLGDGQYYWSMQSIDNCYAGSKFAQEQTFTVSNVQSCPAGMISYWKLDETSGKTYADAMGTNTGIGGTVSPVPVSGRVNGGQQFNGSSSQINVEANPTLDFGASDDFTIELWIKRGGTLSRFETAIGRSGMDNSARWHIGLNTDGRVNFYATTGGSGTL